MRKMPKAALITSFIALFLFAALVPVCPAHTERIKKPEFTSPSGGYTVVFTELKHRKFTKEEMLAGLDNVSHVLYRLDFIKKGFADPSASANYADVYGWKSNGKPLPADSIFKMIAWSPKEDFVILPEEAWASAPGTAEMRAVAINPQLPWKESAVPIENFIWLDSLRVIGDYHNDCDYGVARFDGSAGKAVSLKESESPIGYELISVDKGVIKMRMVLDNCRMQDIAPRCLTHDLSTGAESMIPCPSLKKKPGRF